MNKAASHSDKAKADNLFLNTPQNVSLWIDTYDDLFSDFDPRPFDERNLSDDFIFELKKFSGEKESTISSLTLLIPQAARNLPKEAIIIKRLNQFFRQNYNLLKRNQRKKRRKGIRQILIGIILMSIASYISLIKSENFSMHTLLVLTEPAGWFMLWSGLETFFNSTPEIKPDIAFFDKLMKTKITFVEY